MEPKELARYGDHCIEQMLLYGRGELERIHEVTWDRIRAILVGDTDLPLEEYLGRAIMEEWVLTCFPPSPSIPGDGGLTASLNAMLEGR